MPLSSSVAVVIASPSCQFIGELLSTSGGVPLFSLMPLKGTTTREASCRSVCLNSCQTAAVTRHIGKLGPTHIIVCPSACDEIRGLQTGIFLLGVGRLARKAPFDA